MADSSGTVVQVSPQLGWVNLVSTFPGLAGVASWVQNRTSQPLLVFYSSSASKPTASVGLLLAPGDVMNGTAANVWVQSINDSGYVTCGLLDNSAGPVSIADGQDAALGAKADTAATNSTSAWSVIALLKGLYALLAGVLTTKTAATVGTDRSIIATTTSQTLAAANAARNRLIIKNDSATVVWINLGGAAVATPGGGNISIAANGGYLELIGTSGAVTIIAASGTAAITAREF